MSMNKFLGENILGYILTSSSFMFKSNHVIFKVGHFGNPAGHRIPESMDYGW